MKKRTIFLKAFVIGWMAISIPTGCNTIPNPLSQSIIEQEETSVLDYVLTINNYFKTQSVQSEHQSLVDQLIQDFENDLINDSLDGYYQVPDFSIKLLSGSEGSYFNSDQDLSQIASTEASFAQALVINADQSTQVFKGQFTNERFYFPGPNSLTSENTTYLVTLDNNLQTQIYSGQLLAQSEGSYLTSPDNTSIDSGNLPQQDIPQALPVASGTPVPENATPTSSSPTSSPTPAPSATPTFQPIASGTSPATPINNRINTDLPLQKDDCPPPPLPKEVVDTITAEAPELLSEVENLNKLKRKEHHAKMTELAKLHPQYFIAPPPLPKDNSCPPDGDRPLPPHLQRENVPPPPPRDGQHPPPPPNRNSPDYKRRAEKFNKALKRHQDHFSPFTQRVKRMKLKPPPPPPPRDGKRPPPPPPRR